ncbi:NADPH-dependent FMN reductase [Streptomyces turgidiscabies]|uniref:Flavin reductase n=1 Tax=Streptomyces turgidiscabies (strain Car8) TaxID=698760 RepID=L7FDR1_STRT8|nr:MULTISPECIES: NAD(P)H-dependent oxidoreductase [Streptomyces]ELP69314.1 flavin reductase [Streptomyces turgidiscabies Car8]MDX3494920.1 NAD(P)H-dependent oxidoreductase [Streptomyces turgidiscabies]GAQ70793.1 NADPH azoreductase [Streptomyces turgidiscabies]
MTVQPSASAVTLTTVVASTRPGRVGRSVADWFTLRVADDDRFESHTVDLRELALPFFDEPHPPALRRYTKSHTREWSRIVDTSDAFVFVTPEYNGGFPAPLKNAWDYLAVEWQHKPAAFVSYGGVSAGTRAVQMGKQVVANLRMLPIGPTVSIPFVGQFVEDGEFSPGKIHEAAAEQLLDELARTGRVMRRLRSGTY